MDQVFISRLGSAQTHAQITKMLNAAPFDTTSRSSPNHPFTFLNSGPILQIGDECASWPATADCTSFAAEWDANMILVLLAGSTVLQWPALTSSYLNAPPSGGSRSDPVPSILRAARHVYDSISARVTIGDRTIYLAGYSLGGAIAHGCVYYFRSQLRRVCRSVYTYGAPRAGGQAFADSINQVTSCAFRTVGDTTVFIPPHANELPPVHVPLNRSTSLRLNTYVNVPFGYEVNSGGVIRQGEPFSSQAGGVRLTLSDLIGSTQGFLAPEHQIATYYRYFSSAPAPSPPPTPPPVPNPPIGPLVQTVTERNRTLEVGNAEIRAAADPTSPYYVPIIIPSRPPTPTSHFSPRRVGRLWGIVFGVELVAAGLHRRAAHTMSRKWNRAMRAGKLN